MSAAWAQRVKSAVPAAWRRQARRVPPAIYEASDPCWFFNRAALLAAWGPGWRVAAEWPTDDEVDIDATHGGLMLEQTSP